MHLQKDILFW